MHSHSDNYVIVLYSRMEYDFFSYKECIIQLSECCVKWEVDLLHN